MQEKINLKEKRSVLNTQKGAQESEHLAITGN